LPPELVEVGSSVLLLPVGTNQIVSGRVGLAGEQRHELQCALAVVKRRNQGLDDAGGSVISARITPSFEFVRLIDMPLTKLGCFVLIETVVYAQRNFALLEGIGKVEVGGRIVSRIAAKNNEQIHLAAVHVGDEIFNRFSLIDRIGIDRVSIENGLAD